MGRDKGWSYFEDKQWYLFGGFTPVPWQPYIQSLEYLGPGITPVPWHLYIQGVWDVWLEVSSQPLASILNVWVELSIPGPLTWELPQSRLHLQENPAKW